MIVGFPGETPVAHRNMLEGISRLRFDRLGAFQYSPQDDTPAGQLPRQVGSRTREKRWHAIMGAQAQIAHELSARRLGERTRVLIESHDPQQNAWVGRSPAEAPEIDGKVFVKSDQALTVGEFVDVQITRAETYDVYALPLTDSVQ